MNTTIPATLTHEEDLATLPEAKRSLYRLLKVLEAACLAVIIAAFALAMYLSITWKAARPEAIATAWFIFAASFAPMLVLTGAKAVLLKVYPPSGKPGKSRTYVTGSKALGFGLVMILAGLADAALWGLFAYATWTLNFALLEPLIRILGTVLGLGIALSILASMVMKIFKTL